MISNNQEEQPLQNKEAIQNTEIKFILENEKQQIDTERKQMLENEKQEIELPEKFEEKDKKQEENQILQKTLNKWSNQTQTLSEWKQKSITKSEEQKEIEKQEAKNAQNSQQNLISNNSSIFQKLKFENLKQGNFFQKLKTNNYDKDAILIQNWSNYPERDGFNSREEKIEQFEQCYYKFSVLNDNEFNVKEIKENENIFIMKNSKALYQKGKLIICQNLENDDEPLTCEVDNDSKLRAVAINNTESFYILGFQNGEIEGIYADETFQKIDFDFGINKDQDMGGVVEIFFTTDNIISVSHEKGLYKFYIHKIEIQSNKKQLNFQLIFNIQLQNLLKNSQFIFVSNYLDKKFLIVGEKIQQSPQNNEIYLIEEFITQTYEFDQPKEERQRQTQILKTIENDMTNKIYLVKGKKLLVLSESKKGIDFQELRIDLQKFDAGIETCQQQTGDIHTGQIFDFILQSDEKSLITASEDKTIKIYDIELKQLSYSLQTGCLIFNIALSSNNIIAAASESKIELWNLQNNIKICNFPIMSSFQIDSIEFSSYNNILSVKNINGDQVIWRISDLPQERIKSKNKIKLALINNDYSRLITNDEQYQVHIWDINTKQQLWELKDPQKIQQVFNSSISNEGLFYKKTDSIYCGYLQQFKKEFIYQCGGIITNTKIDERNEQIYIMNRLKNTYTINIFPIYNSYEMINDNEFNYKDTITLKETHNFESFNKIYNEDYNKWSSFEESNIEPIFCLIDGSNSDYIHSYGLLAIQSGSDKIQIYQILPNINVHSIIAEIKLSELKQGLKEIQNFKFNFKGNQVLLFDGFKQAKLALNKQKPLSIIKFDNIRQMMKLYIDKSQIILDFKLKAEIEKQFNSMFGEQEQSQENIYDEMKPKLDMFLKNCRLKRNSIQLTELMDKIESKLAGKEAFISMSDLYDRFKDLKFNQQINQIDFRFNFELKYMIQAYNLESFFLFQNIGDEIQKENLQMELYQQECNQWSLYYNNEPSKDLYHNCQVIYGQNNQIFGFLDQSNNIKYIKDFLIEYLQQSFDNKENNVLSKLEKISTLRKSQLKQDNNESNSKILKFEGKLNYVIPLIILEMKNDPENAPKYIEFLKDTFIEEFNLNIFNWIAYKNLNQFTEACLLSKIKFKRDAFGNTPLSYFLKYKSKDAIDQILNYACEKDNDLIIRNLSQREIRSLIKQSPQNLSILLQNSMQKKEQAQQVHGIIQYNGLTGQTDVPQNERKFFLDYGKNNITIYEGIHYIKDENRFADNAPIDMFVIKLKLDFKPGSLDSLLFHQAVNDSQDFVFQNECIQRIIEYKWNQNYYFAIGVMLISLTYIIYLMNYTQNQGNQKYAYGLIPFLVVSIFPYIMLSIKRLINIRRNNKKFKGKLKKIKLSQLWNYVDFIFNVLFLIYIIVELGFIEIVGHQKNLFAFLNIFSWLKFASALRVFTIVRMFLHMIIDIVYALRDFLFFLLFVLFTFGTTFTILMQGYDYDDDNNFSNFMYIMYQYIFQQFPAALLPQYDTQNSVPVNYTMVEPNLFPFYDTQISYLMFFHVLAQLLISLILMNLVVALINDALVKSLTKKDQEYFKETNLLIIYCEKIKNFMNICPSQNYVLPNLHFLQYSVAEEVQDDDLQLQELSSKIQNVLDKLAIQEEQNKSIHAQIEKIQQNLTSKAAQDSNT